MAAVFLFVPLPSGDDATRGLMRIGGGTDNLGNTFVVAKMMTTKMPLAAVLMQLAVMLSDRRLWLEAAWVPREQNKEADALTNNCYEGFDPALRIPLVWADFPTGVMQMLLDQGLAFEKELDLRRAQKRVDKPISRSAKKMRADRTVWAFEVPPIS